MCVYMTICVFKFTLSIYIHVYIHIYIYIYIVRACVYERVCIGQSGYHIIYTYIYIYVMHGHDICACIRTHGTGCIICYMYM